MFCSLQHHQSAFLHHPSPLQSLPRKAQDKPPTERVSSNYQCNQVPTLQCNTTTHAQCVHLLSDTIVEGLGVGVGVSARHVRTAVGDISLGVECLVKLVAEPRASAALTIAGRRSSAALTVASG